MLRIALIFSLMIFSLAPHAMSANVPAVPPGYIACAKDGGKCETSGAWTGFYGANATFMEISGSGSFTCLPGAFNNVDPVPNVQKTCFIKTVPTGQSEVPNDPVACRQSLDAAIDKIRKDYDAVTKGAMPIGYCQNSLRAIYTSQKSMDDGRAIAKELTDMTICRKELDALNAAVKKQFAGLVAADAIANAWPCVKVGRRT